MLSPVKAKKIVFGVITCLCFVFAALCAAGYYIYYRVNVFSLDITLQGEREITLEYGQRFADPGAEAVCFGTLFQKTPVAVPVETEGQVDTGKIGVYEIRYYAKYRGLTASASRTVTVADTQAPVITLVTDPEAYTLPGHSYQEEGFTAVDNYDGDITSLVQRKEADGKVVYTVTDSSGNTARAEREIVYDNPFVPEIILAGDAVMEMDVGEAYKEPGFSARDCSGGDVTAQVAVEGTVNRYVPGTYSITYSVTDGAGNTTTAAREVVVRERSPETAKGVIYLTFDDGPSPYTGQLLDILEKYKIKATFFVVNTGYPEEMTRAAELGHTIGIHSATHSYGKIYDSEDAFFSDLYKMQSVIEEYTGQTPALMRFPGGSSNTVSCFNPGIMTRLTQMVEEKGFRYFDWNVDSNDAGGASTAEEVFDNVISGVSSHTKSVVLQHDSREFSVMAVERIIQWGLENGYIFRQLDADSPTCHHGVNN